VSADIFRPLHFVSSARKLSALTGKTFLTETAAKFPQPGKPRSPGHVNLPQTPKIKTTTLPGAEFLGDCLRRFYARHHPTVAARPSDTEPSLGARSKPAPAPPHSQIVAVTAFAFADFLTRFRARLAVSRTREASSKRQGDGQRF